MGRGAVFLAFVFAGLNAWACGKYRWAIKTGADPQAQQINVNQVHSVSVSEMASLTAPAHLPQNSRIQPTEMEVFSIKATIIAVRSEADHDYHLILQGPSGNTMDAEVPAPNCVASSSPFLSQIQTVRSEVDQSGLIDTGHINVPATVTGVGFFDFPHAGGAARNGIELHPVLNVQFDK